MVLQGPGLACTANSWIFAKPNDGVHQVISHAKAHTRPNPLQCIQPQMYIPEPKALAILKTLHTVSRAPQTLNPKSQTLNPKRSTLNPKPPSLNPKTRNSEPQAAFFRDCWAGPREAISSGRQLEACSPKSRPKDKRYLFGSRVSGLGVYGLGFGGLGI